MEIAKDAIILYVLLAMAVFSAHQAVAEIERVGVVRALAPLAMACVIGCAAVVAVADDGQWWRAAALGLVLGASTLEIGKYVLVPLFKLVVKIVALKLGGEANLPKQNGDKDVGTH